MSFLRHKIARLFYKIPYRRGINPMKAASARQTLVNILGDPEACRRAEHKSFISLVAALEDWCKDIRQREGMQTLIQRERDRIADERWNRAWNDKVSAQLKRDDDDPSTDNFGYKVKL